MGRIGCMLTSLAISLGIAAGVIVPLYLGIYLFGWIRRRRLDAIGEHLPCPECGHVGVVWSGWYRIDVNASEHIDGGATFYCPECDTDFTPQKKDVTTF